MTRTARWTVFTERSNFFETPPLKAMSIRVRSLISLFALPLALACGESSTGITPAAFYGQWERTEDVLPPVSLTVRVEGTGTVGQVWLSGVTYTLPAVIDDSTIVLANPASSQLAPFVGVMLRNGVMRATLRGQSDVVVELVRKK